MTTWERLHILALYHDVLNSQDRIKITEYVNGLQGTGKLNDEDIKEYLEFWQVSKVKELWDKYNVKIMNKIYNAS